MFGFILLTCVMPRKLKGTIDNLFYIKFRFLFLIILGIIFMSGSVFSQNQWIMMLSQYRPCTTAGLCSCVFIRLFLAGLTRCAVPWYAHRFYEPISQSLAVLVQRVCDWSKRNQKKGKNKSCFQQSGSKIGCDRGLFIFGWCL